MTLRDSFLLSDLAPGLVFCCFFFFRRTLLAVKSLKYSWCNYIMWFSGGFTWSRAESLHVSQPTAPPAGNRSASLSGRTDRKRRSGKFWHTWCCHSQVHRKHRDLNSQSWLVRKLLMNFSITEKSCAFTRTSDASDAPLHRNLIINRFLKHIYIFINNHCCAV